MPSTVAGVFADTARAHAAHPFLIVPARADRDWSPGGVEVSYGAALAEVERLRDLYAARRLRPRPSRLDPAREPAGVLLPLPGAQRARLSCIVPINPDYRHDEIAYLLDHSEVELAVVLPHRVDDVAQRRGGARQAAARRRRARHAGRAAAAVRRRAPRPGAPGLETRVLAALHLGHHRAAQGLPAVELLHAQRRRNLSQPRRADRYPPRPGAVLQSAAAVPHQPPQHHVDGGHADRQHADPARALLADALVARGVDTRRHHHPLPRHRRADAAEPAAGPGRPQPQGALRHRRRHRAAAAQRVRGALRLPHDRGVGHDRDGPHHGRLPRAAHDRHARVRPAVPGAGGARGGRPGQATCRWARQASSSCATRPRQPRHGFFSGYLKNEKATEEAWRGGWFHTGDVVRQDASGMLFFVDRKKHIIRRAGENIAAAEIEAVLQAHDAVAQVAVVAAPDELREEEVLACIVPMPGIQAGRRRWRRRCSSSATRGSPTSRRRAGCCSSTSCPPRARRRCRRPRSSRPARTRASAPASSTCARRSGGARRACRAPPSVPHFSACPPSTKDSGKSEASPLKGQLLRLQ